MLPISDRFARFLVVGGFAALINFLSGMMLRTWLAFAAAALVAYAIGMIVAFVLNRRLVFLGTSSPVHVQATWFVLVNMIGATLTVTIGVLFAHIVLPALQWSWYPDTVAHAIGIAMPVFTSYLGHRHLSFR